MNEKSKNKIGLLLIAMAMQVVFIGCSSQSPMAPEIDARIAAATAEGRAITGATNSPVLSTQGIQGGQDARAASDFNERYTREDVSKDIEFTGLIVGFDAEAQTIRLMEMSGSFKTWTGHVDENSELFGLNDETVTLADFGVCSQAIVRGVQISETELTINYLKMKN